MKELFVTGLFSDWRYTITDNSRVVAFKDGFHTYLLAEAAGKDKLEQLQQPEADRGEGERKPILSRLLPNHINLLRGIVKDGCIELFTDASYALMDAGWLEHNNVVSRRVNKNMLTPTVKALDFLKMLDESNEALQAENTRLRGELDAARGALADVNGSLDVAETTRQWAEMLDAVDVGELSIHDESVVRNCAKKLLRLADALKADHK